MALIDDLTRNLDALPERSSDEFSTEGVNRIADSFEKAGRPVLAQCFRDLAKQRDELAARLAATPPADAALADSIDSLGFVISGDNPPVKEWVSECGGGCMPATKEEKMMWDMLHAALRARAVPQSAPAGFVEWLCQEMPPGTVISDPAWWAPKIHRAMLAASKEGK